MALNLLNRSKIRLMCYKYSDPSLRWQTSSLSVAPLSPPLGGGRDTAERSNKL